jgi:hypothetical protein
MLKTKKDNMKIEGRVLKRKGDQGEGVKRGKSRAGYGCGSDQNILYTCIKMSQ